MGPEPLSCLRLCVCVCAWGGKGWSSLLYHPIHQEKPFSLKLPGLELHNPHSEISARKPFLKCKSISLLQLLSQTNRKGPEPYLLHRMQRVQRGVHT